MRAHVEAAEVHGASVSSWETSSVSTSIVCRWRRNKMVGYVSCARHLFLLIGNDVRRGRMVMRYYCYMD